MGIRPSLWGNGARFGLTEGLRFRRGGGFPLRGLIEVRTRVGFSQQFGEQRVLLPTVMNEREIWNTAPRGRALLIP
jgi:hypothetical protein